MSAAENDADERALLAFGWGVFSTMDDFDTFPSKDDVFLAGAHRDEVLRNFESIRKLHASLFDAHIEMDSEYVPTMYTSLCLYG